MNCAFCHGADGKKLSREHLVSQPVAEAFGINRSNYIATIDGWTPGSDDFQLERMARIADLSVRLPCTVCNATWMNQLEHGMKAIAKWSRSGDTALTRDAHRTLQRWLLKTYIVMAAMDGGTRRFGQSDDFYLLPDATRGRLLWQDNDAAMKGVTFGIARGPSAGSFNYSFGNPTITSGGKPMVNVRNSGALALSVGLLNLCIVVPFYEARVALPSSYASLRAGGTFRSLKLVKRLPHVGEFTVDNDPENVRQVLAAIDALSNQPPAA